MKRKACNRRKFLHAGVAWAAGAPFLFDLRPSRLMARETAAADNPPSFPSVRADAKVAIVSCRTYGAELRPALDRCFDLLGGIGSLVKHKTVTVKVNLTGTNFTHYLGRPVGETYMTHPATAMALVSALFAAGASRVKLAESTQSKSELAASLAFADWDVRALAGMGRVEFENTRNLGTAKTYAHLPVPGGGYMFSSFDVNQAYADTDVMVSLAKLKTHAAAGITLSMKNLFGITPNSLYGAEAGREDATDGRDPLHDPSGFDRLHLPGLKPGIASKEQTWRVPHIVADLCAARPIHLAIIDGITAMRGGEGPWCESIGKVSVTTPGVLIAGLNPVSTDAVGAAVMGYADPRVARGTKPFESCENHLLLAEHSGIGVAGLGRIDLRGLSLNEARYAYD